MHYLLTMGALFQSEEGLTLAEVLDEIPTDPASVFTILLLFGSLGAVFWFGKGSNDKRGRT